MKRIMILVLLVLFSTPSIAEPKIAPNGFKAIKWGSSPSSAMKKYAGGMGLYVLANGKKPEPIFDTPVAEEHYSYTKGKFYSGSAYLDGLQNLVKIKAALSKEYGAPTFSNEQSKIWKWKWPNNKIEIHLYHQERFSRTTVTFLNNSI